MGRLKNVIIINDFDYVQGGASKIAIDTANLLVNKSDLNVYFFSGCSSEKSPLDTKVIRICTNQGEALNCSNKLYGSFFGLYNFKAEKELTNLLKKMDSKDTIIHVHGWTKSLSSSIFRSIAKNKFKFVLTLHDYFSICPNGGFFNFKNNSICKYKALSYKCICSNCDSRNYFFKVYRVLRQFIQNFYLNSNLKYAICVSEFSKKLIKKNLNSCIKYYTIYNPIDFFSDITKHLGLKNSYIYVGRISYEKGADIFCKAITELSLSGLVVGDGPELNNLKNMYPNINFVGWKSSDEVKELVVNSKCLVFPSRLYETAGLTVAEALSLKVPCIVSSQTAAVEYLQNNNNGLIYENYDELLECIKKIENGCHFKFNDNKIIYSNEKYLNELFDCYIDIMG